MIKSITLENWKTHHKTHLEFGKGTNVIIGKMGSGKSSIMDAISFALYGTYPGIVSRKVNLEETIMAKPMKADYSKVKLEFVYDKKNYFVERQIKRKGINEAKLTCDNKIIAGPKTSEVTKKIETITEVNYDLFSRAIYSEQNQIDFFIKLSASQRKEKIDELLGLDKYEKVRSNAVSLANRIKKNTQDKQTFLEEQTKKTDKSEKEEYMKKIMEKEKEIKENEEEAKKILKEIEVTEKQIKELEKKETEKKFYKELEIKAKTRLESLRDDLKKTKEKLHGKDYEKIKETITHNMEKIQKETETKKESEKKKKETETTEQKLNQEKAVCANLIKTAEKNEQQIDSLHGNCPTCKRPFKDHEKEEAKKEFIETKKKNLQEAEKLTEKIAKLAETKKNMENEIKKTDEIIDEKRKENEELKTLLSMAENAKEKQEQSDKLEEEIKKIEIESGKIIFDETQLKKQREAISEIKEKNAKTKAQINAGKELVKELEISLKRIEQIEQQLEKIGKEIKQGDEATEKLAIFTSALKSTQAELRHLMIETINEAMEDIWGRLYPYKDFDSAKIMVQEGSYEIMARQRNGEWVRVEGILSGGERSTAALTIRIAISLVLTQNLSWIILDEPTHNLDSNGVRELSETMRNHLPELIEQIFVITHDKQMENAATGQIYLLEREKEKDGITKIAETE